MFNRLRKIFRDYVLGKPTALPKKESVEFENYVMSTAAGILHTSAKVKSSHFAAGSTDLYDITRLLIERGISNYAGQLSEEYGDLNANIRHLLFPEECVIEVCHIARQEFGAPFNENVKWLPDDAQRLLRKVSVLQHPVKRLS